MQDLGIPYFAIEDQSFCCFFQSKSGLDHPGYQIWITSALRRPYRDMVMEKIGDGKTN